MLATKASMCTFQRFAYDRNTRKQHASTQQHCDGITLHAAGLPDLTRAIGKMLPSVSVEQQDSSFLQNTAEQVKTAGAFGLLAIHNRNSRTQQVRAGRLWERMHLWATKEGLAMQPLNQATERASREAVRGSLLTLAMSCARWWVMLPGRPS